MENAGWLPLFQNTCEEYGLTPTYLVADEMAECPVFRLFALDVLRRKTAEIGLLVDRPEAPQHGVRQLASRLRETLDVAVTSHRAESGPLSAAYAQTLVELGIRVDCSVNADTVPPPHMPYELDAADWRRAGTSGLLEVPATTMRDVRPASERFRAAAGNSPLLGRVLDRRWPRVCRLHPDGRNLKSMLRIVEGVLERGEPYAQLELRSPELMPGGSPQFPGAGSIDGLYRDLRSLFRVVEPGFRGSTLTAFSREIRQERVTA
jgi:hypothetical protein